MIVQERLPALGWRSLAPVHVFGDRRLPDIDAELEQFADGSRRVSSVGHRAVALDRRDDRIVKEHQRHPVAGLDGRGREDERQHGTRWIGRSPCGGNGEMHGYPPRIAVLTTKHKAPPTPIRWWMFRLSNGRIRTLRRHAAVKERENQ